MEILSLLIQIICIVFIYILSVIGVYKVIDDLIDFIIVKEKKVTIKKINKKRKNKS